MYKFIHDLKITDVPVGGTDTREKEELIPFIVLMLCAMANKWPILKTHASFILKTVMVSLNYVYFDCNFFRTSK